MEKLYPSWTLAWRNIRFAASTLLGGPARGYFIPYRYAEDMPTGHEVAAYRPIEDIFDRALPIFEEVFALAQSYRDELQQIGTKPAPAPRFDQGWFPTLDAVAGYCLIRHHQPARIIEVGSGHSTRFFHQAIVDGKFACDFTAIDPAPRAIVKGLDVTFLAQTLNQVDLTMFDTLRAGDVLSIDSSHILMPGSDVDDLLNRVLPRLPAGVYLQVHDIFLPDPYPAAWTWRGYNEQLAIAALLTSGAYRPIFASHYMRSRQRPQLTQNVIADLPDFPDSYPASLWLVKA